MKLSRNRLILLGAMLTLIGGGTAFLLKVTSKAEAPSPARPSAIQNNPAHELKELGVQLEQKPGHTPILMRMAQIERDQGKLDDAIGHLQEVVKNEPGNADAHVELGRILYEKGDVSGAIAETEKALAANPKNVDALYNLGAIYANIGNAPRATSYWKDAMNAAPQSDSGKKARESLAKLQGVAVSR